MARTTGTIDVTRTSQISGKSHTLTLPMSESEFITRYTRYRRGDYIQDAFDNLEADLREFISTGITPKEWRDTFTWMEEEE